MTTLGADRPSRLRALMRGSGGLAVAILVMNVATYGFQIVAARALGPAAYGAVASLMALLLVVAVVQLGLQATAARRIAATPENVSKIAPAMLRLTVLASVALGLVLLAASPLVWHVLRLESIVPALLVALSAVPLTMVGGQAGILQGERRWLALGILYLSMGVPRLLFGTLFILVKPNETAAMIGVALGAFTAVAVGAWLLRDDVHHGEGERDPLRNTLRESTRNTLALLAFFALSNADIVVARNVLDSHDAGLYAGGLILTKAVLFLPQFVVVVAFPAMSTPGERRRALIGSLGLVLLLGLVAVLGAWLLSDVAMIFIGGDEYAEVQDQLWLFAILGTLLSMLQLLVYAVLARQGGRSAILFGAAVVALAIAATMITTLDQLILTVIAIDSVLLAALLAISLWRLSRQPAAPALGAPPT
ncbi:MAG TPA: polysaccharide biosynthesis protein [Nocardioides sp.]|nr:polysaccharide biosynthesis protein [Nocardioides sp.]